MAKKAKSGGKICPEGKAWARFGLEDPYDPDNDHK